MESLKKSRSVLVTGVSTGIGLSVARALTKRGYRVFGSVRSREDADRVSADLGPGLIAIVFDVTDPAAIARARATVESQLNGEGLAGLVNNSGIGIGGPLQHQPLEVFRSHFEVNVFGLLQVTREFLPLLGACEAPKSAPGRILNISSVAGKLAVPFLGGYVASKHAVEGLSQVLRRELLLFGIDVIVIGPGAVNTPIWDKGNDTSPYAATPYGKILARFNEYFTAQGKKGFAPDVFGEKIADILETPKPRTRYALVPQKFGNWTIPRLLPDRTLDRIIGKGTGLLKRS